MMLTFTSSSTVYERTPPVARAMADPVYGVIGSVVKISAQSSTDPSALSSKSGSAAITSGAAISAPTGNFGSGDIGRVIRLAGSDTGRYLIVAVSSSTSVVVSALNGGGVVFIGGSNQWAIDDSLSYKWRFVTIPIGSRVAQEGFRVLETDNSLVSFSPDVVGEYIVGLIASNAVFDSPEETTRVSIRAILVPHGRGLIPDGKFIWSYIRDVWQEVENKELFETFWSALVQICGAELLKLYQTDFNKSIRDIQDLYQRRWLSYEPKLDLVEADCTFYVGDQCAGTDGSSLDLAITGQAIILNRAGDPLNHSGEVLVTLGSVLPDVLGDTFKITADSLAPTNVGSYDLVGKNIQNTGYRLVASLGPDPLPNEIIPVAGVGPEAQFFFGFQETTWGATLTAGSPQYALIFSQYPTPLDELAGLFEGSISAAVLATLRVGDIVHYPKGANAGIYRILSISGSFITVDRKPPSFSEIGFNFAHVYRPVEFSILPASARPVVGSSFSVPLDATCNVSLLAVGRVIVFGGQTYTIIRSFIDLSRGSPYVIIVTDGVIPVGQIGLPWRAPNTLVSKTQNFEALGIEAGDLIEFDVTNDNAGLLSTIRAQVVGVDRYRLGFVFNDEPLTAGVVPGYTNEAILTLVNDFGISGVKQNDDGSLSFSGSAAEILSVLNSGIFHRKYWNVPLTSSTDFNVLKGVFHLHPKFVIRNSKVPVDVNIKSIPVLQDWIVQPTVVQHDAKNFQRKGDREYEIKTLPVSLVENNDFIVDNEIAYSGKLTFNSGSDLLTSETGHFVDRGLKPGDTFEIESPSTLAGTFYVLAVVSPTAIKLNRPVPVYVINPSSVTAQVILRRRNGGQFIRFIPGGFSSRKQAPNRLWAEVSFFDNRPTIEDNFGILVGLTKEDLESVSTDISYRQAVAGLMFAYSHGAAVNKIRLGAQILLGLPFAEHRGIIRSIENNYRLDDVGTPILGRILIEDIDISGKELGTLRVYTYPIDLISALAGVDINPATGKEYVVGDTVEAFAALSKGVEVTDYLSKPDTSVSGINKVRQYHTARLRANDSIFSIKEMGLLSAFLKRITPSYISMIISILAEFQDDVAVTDATFQKILFDRDDPPIVDQVSMRIPAVPKYDSKNTLGLNTVFFDGGPAWVRMARYDTLSTTYNGSSTVATLPTGGFVTPAFGEGPVAKTGDVLVIPSGVNAGQYAITSVTNTTVTVSGLPVSGFQTALQTFFILRYPTGEIRRGVCSSDGAGNISMEVGLTSDGVTTGDVLVTQDGYRSTVVDVGPHAVTVDGQGVVVPLLAAGSLKVLPVMPVFATKNYRIYRDSFFEAPYDEDTSVLHSTGTVYDTFSNAFLLAFLEPGDSLQVQNTSLTELFVVDPVASRLVFVPVLPVGNYTVKIIKSSGLSAPITWDHTEKFCPSDFATIAIREDQALATCTTGSPIVSLQEERTSPVATPAVAASISLIKPGDFLVLTSGANASLDVGYGPGIFPIKIVASPNVTLSANLTSNNSSAWKIQRRR